MNRKRDINTHQIKKWKVRLNVGVSRIKKGVHYAKFYSPVVGWSYIRILLISVTLEGWKNILVEYVQAFPQAPIEKDLYIKVPAGFQVWDGDNNDYTIKIHRNIYDPKQYGRVWCKYLINNLLKEIGFIKSEIDGFVFYRWSVMYILYTDYSIVAGPNQD